MKAHGLRLVFALRVGTVLAAFVAVGFLSAIRQGSGIAYEIAVFYTVTNALWRVRRTR